ncbi:MAG TPA: VWA domain-containing protein [Acidimicrobiales bacterium]|nr:VWA domain-containing protein [Acidimicrobiales bacterium]
MSEEFPFAAVVGLDDVKLALLLSAVDRRIGGVLLRGQKGSAKTTLARGVAALLPGSAPFVELPIGAGEDRVIGTIDLAAALRTGERVFRQGLLADVDGGVLYVDEVNLLPDHLVDVLLDVAVSGVNRVEREGVSHVHPSRFVLVGSMNPEEGELRPQLLDRFGLAVDVAASVDPVERAEAVRRRMAFDGDPGAFAQRFGLDTSSLRGRLSAARPGSVDDSVLAAISSLCASVGAEGLRADLVIARAAAALAGWEGRTAASVEDVRRVAHLALAHRRRRGPFEEHGIDQSEIDSALKEAEASSGEGGAGSRAASDSRSGEGSGDFRDVESTPDVDSASQIPSGAESAPQPPAQVGSPTPPPPALLRPPRTAAAPGNPAEGKRSTAVGSRGRHVRDRVPDLVGEPVGPVALTATVSAIGERVQLAAANGTHNGRHAEALVEPEDIREAVLEQKVANLVVLVVDASGSMGVATRMEAVKGAVLGLLLDAYQRRDRVAVVTFAGEGAQVALRPTGSVEIARARLESLQTGGRTPLAAGVLAALEVCLSEQQRSYRPLMVVVSDGRATLADDGADPVAASLAAARIVRKRGIASVVIDAEEGGISLGLAAPLAEAMGATYARLDSFSAGGIEDVVRSRTVTK